MKLPRYELIAEKSLKVYEFISEGPKGQILKLIKFSETDLKDFYNFALGDKNLETGEIDDKVILIMETANRFWQRSLQPFTPLQT